MHAIHGYIHSKKHPTWVRLQDRDRERSEIQKLGKRNPRSTWRVQSKMAPPSEHRLVVDWAVARAMPPCCIPGNWYAVVCDGSDFISSTTYDTRRPTAIFFGRMTAFRYTIDNQFRHRAHLLSSQGRQLLPSLARGCHAVAATVVRIVVHDEGGVAVLFTVRVSLRDFFFTAERLLYYSRISYVRDTVRETFFAL